MRVLIVATALLLPAAAVSAASPLPGTVVVTLAEADADDAAVDGPFVDAVGQALGDANFTTMTGPEHSRYIAQVGVVREGRGVVTTRVTRDRASAAIGSWGPAVSVPLGSKKTRLSGLVVTTLNVRLLTRADRQVVWSGSAVTAQVEDAAVATKLARAAVATYPQTLPAPVSVP